MGLRLYNTLTRKVEPFAPLDPGGRRVLFYSCGPTVYDYAHIGNFRSFLNADLLRRTLELLGYEVRHVMNMTDVGHMTDDEVSDGAGVDKMEEAARRLKEAKKSGRLPEHARGIDPNDPYQIAEFYINAFLEDARALGLKVAQEAKKDPALMPRPTQFIEQMIGLIRSLLAKGHAYVAADGVVYFDVQSFPDYGKLSGNTLDQLRAGEGGRVSAENLAVKKHPADFLLWKPDPRHLMRWPSPWGEGYPGWHLECSVMAQTLLGDEIDIHSGGEDNIFPHHECEIAQTCAATGRERFARYWFHTRHLLVDGEKMSKSKGTFYTVRDLIARGASPAAIRLALTSTHYRVNANFTTQVLKDWQKRVERWQRAREATPSQRAGPAPAPASSDLPGAFIAALCDDLNVSGAIKVVEESIQQGIAKPALEGMLETLGVGNLQWKSDGGGVFVSDSMPLVMPAMPSDSSGATREWIESMLRYRAHLRAQKNYAAADQVRDDLLSFGIEIKDSPDGTTWERVVQ